MQAYLKFCRRSLWLLLLPFKSCTAINWWLIIISLGSSKHTKVPVTSYECTSLLTSGSGDGENINNKKTSAEEWKPSTAGSTLLTVLQLIVIMVSPPTLMTNVGDVYEVMCSGGDEMETSCERSINLLSRVGCCFVCPDCLGGNQRCCVYYLLTSSYSSCTLVRWR